MPEDLERYFDNKYTMATSKFLNGHYSFDGYTSTRILFDNETHLWKLELLSDTTIHATTELIPIDSQGRKGRFEKRDIFPFLFGAILYR